MGETLVNVFLHLSHYNWIGIAGIISCSILLAKPIILKWDDQVPFEPGKTARLFCEAEGNPPPNVTIWKMKRTNKIALKNIQRYGNGTAYVILKTNKDTKGQYACTAENSFGVTEKSTTLSEAGLLI